MVLLDSVIITLLCSGHSNKQIAYLLGVPNGYIDNRMTKIYCKMGIADGNKRAKLAQRIVEETMNRKDFSDD